MSTVGVLYLTYASSTFTLKTYQLAKISSTPYIAGVTYTISTTVATVVPGITSVTIVNNFIATAANIDTGNTLSISTLNANTPSSTNGISGSGTVAGLLALYNAFTYTLTYTISTVYDTTTSATVTVYHGVYRTPSSGISIYYDNSATGDFYSSGTTQGAPGSGTSIFTVTLGTNSNSFAACKITVASTGFDTGYFLSTTQTAANSSGNLVTFSDTNLATACTSNS